MLSFVNDFQGTLSSEMDAEASSLPLPPHLAGRLDFSGGQEYLLTLTDSLDLSKRTANEIVRVSAGLAIERAQEGTSALNWPAGTPVMCSITAGGLAELAASSGGGAAAVHPSPPNAPPTTVGDTWIYRNGRDEAIYSAIGTDSLLDWVRTGPAAGGYAQEILAGEEQNTLELHPLCEIVRVRYDHDRNYGARQTIKIPVLPTGHHTRIELDLVELYEDELIIDFENNPASWTSRFNAADMNPATGIVVEGRWSNSLRIQASGTTRLELDIYTGHAAPQEEGAQLALGWASGPMTQVPVPM